MDGKKKKYCKFPNCGNAYTTGGHNKRYFQFPTDVKTNKAWKEICNIEGSINTSNFVLCEDHFVNNDFVNENKKRLKPGTIPFVQCSNENLSSGFGQLEVDSVPFAQCSNVFEKVCPCSNQPSTSSTICSCESFHTQSASEKTCNVDELKDHDYFMNFVNVPKRCDEFSFLHEGGKGILGKIGLSKKDLTPKKNFMYKIHRNTLSKLSKLKSLLESQRDKIKTLSDLYKTNRFAIIENELNVVTKEFINSQLRNFNRKPHARRWSEQDKVFALSIYKKSPRLYRCLENLFQLPSVRTLKAILSKIPFETGINSAILQHLGNEIRKMKPENRVCALLFDEMSLSEGLNYKENLQKICGFVDLGSLGRSEKHANHALVFMVRGLRKQWKQVVAYYFTANTISTDKLMVIIKEIIRELQGVGLQVAPTVCDQGSTNQSALTKLCSEPHDRQSPFYFFVNDHPIVTIFDVPHLLKNTRNALLKCKLEFEPHKFAYFKYIEEVFHIDQRKSFKALPKLRVDHFNFKDSYVKMKVKVAAAQLSASVASAIETYSVFVELLPAEALHTAEFVKLIDDLFDSLNSAQPRPRQCKPFRCALREGGPHWDLWSKLLTAMDHWKLIDLSSGVDCTNRFTFIRGWQTTMRSIMFLWHRHKEISGFDFFNTRSVNQDSIENLFSSVRQHGVFNTNPTCQHFTAALKTVVVNKLAAPTTAGNCEDDGCTSLDNLKDLLHHADEAEEDQVTRYDEKEVCGMSSNLDTSSHFKNFSKLPEDSQGLAYVSGYILKQIDVSNCDACLSALTTTEMLPSHLLTYFKDRGDDDLRLMYVSERVMLFVQDIHENLYSFLDKNAHQTNLESRFKSEYKLKCGLWQTVCERHDCFGLILDKCTRFLIYKYVRDRKKRKCLSEGHHTKMKRFKKSA